MSSSKEISVYKIQICNTKLGVKKMSNQKKFRFGNEKFGGSYTPGEFEINFPEDMSREDFEKMFSEKMKYIHNKYTKSNEFAEEILNRKSKKENLKPLSIRVKPHTKEFFKKYSKLSPRDVLEMYENYNNGSEAFINSLIEDEKQLEKELSEVQEKLHNAKLFREKLNEIEPEKDILTDDGKIAKLQNLYENTEIKAIGNEIPSEKVKHDLIRDIQIYNTTCVRFVENEYILITVYTNAQPVLYYFKNEYSNEEISQIADSVKKYCEENNIEFD